MKKSIQTVIILLLSSTGLFGQNLTSYDSLKIVETYTKLFEAVKTNDLKTLNEISADSMYCIICFNEPDRSVWTNMVDKNDFIESHLVGIKNSDQYQRATKAEAQLWIKENNLHSDITVLWTIYKEEELAPGHEGGQFGIYFKRINDEFKFAGMETIP